MAGPNFLFLLSFLLFLQSSVQLQCTPEKVQAVIGGSFTVVCNYEKRTYMFSKKYWCLGAARSTCEILKDTYGFTKRELKGRIEIRQDLLKQSLSVVMRELRLADTGYYWVGIDKMFNHLMSPISITVSEVAVSQPGLQFLGPLSGTCWGRPLTVRCASDRGTNVRYGWFRAGGARVIPQGDETDLQLHCGGVRDGEQYYCGASNSVSSKQSRSVSVLLLRPAEEDCVYILTVEGEHQYDCGDRLRTSTALPQDTMEARSFANQSTAVSHNEELDVFVRERSGMPVWYEILRWLLLASLLTSVCLVHRVTKVKAKESEESATAAHFDLVSLVV